MATPQEIKDWMKRTGKTRQWLAEMTLSSHHTVNGWLSAGKTIPAAKLEMIERLMGEDENEAIVVLPRDVALKLIELSTEAQKSIDAMMAIILQSLKDGQKRDSGSDDPS